MKQSEYNVEFKKFNPLHHAKSKKAKHALKDQSKALREQEKDLLEQIIFSNLHTQPQFSAHFGLTKGQCQSKNAQTIFRKAFENFHYLRREHKEYMAFFYDILDEWFKPLKIMPDVPKEFFYAITLGRTVLIRSEIQVERENPEENFRALIELKLKKFIDRACVNSDVKTKEIIYALYQHFVQNPSEVVFECISYLSETQFMIHTDRFPSIQPIIYANGEKLQASQATEIKRRFFHVLYSQKYKSFYDLQLKPEDCQLANNLPFINKAIPVFREEFDMIIQTQLELMKIPKPGNQIQMTRAEIANHRFLKLFAPEEYIRVVGNKGVKKQKQVIPDQTQSAMMIQKRFAQHQKEEQQMEQNLLKEQINNAKMPYSSLYSFYELCQMTQKQIIKSLASHYQISLKYFKGPCYFVGLLLLSFQYVDKKQNTSSFISTQSSLIGFSIKVSEFKGIGVVLGSILGYKIVNQIQLPKFFAQTLQDMLGQQAIVDQNNPLRVFICPQCQCFDQVGGHPCPH